MTSEFDVLNNLWNDYTDGIMDPRFIEDEQWTIRFFKREVNLIQNSITLRAYFYAQSKGNVTNYIHLVQRMLLKLASKINAFSIYFKLFAEAIDELLGFLMADYYHYFDYTLVATASYRVKVINDQQPYVDQIGKFLMDAVIDPELVLIISQYIQGQNHVIETYAQLHYYRTFCREVVNWFIDNPGKYLELTLITGLIYLNFNSPQYISFLKSKVRTKGREINYESAKWENIRNLRNIKQVPDQDTYAYDAKQITIKAQVIIFIETEIDFLNAVKAGGFPFHQIANSNSQTGDYIKVDLTVEQLDFLLRLLIEENIIVVEHMNEFFRFVSNHIRTINRDQELSVRSIKNKYHDVSYSTIKHIHQVLNLLSTRIAKHYINNN
jgi:hypothetical protein